jgi:peptide/nickel transport system ATP-binding protein
VGLSEGAYDRFPHEFSGGQRQRVGIARSLMFDPLVLIADEAVSALDVSIQAEILTLLGEIQKETGLTIVFITHDLRVASKICDDVIVMHEGCIVESGATTQVFNKPAHQYTQQLLAAVPGLKKGKRSFPCAFSR